MCNQEITTIEIIKAIGPYVTAVITLIVALAVVVLNYKIQLKMRKEAHRQELYRRMTTACEEIYHHAFEFCNFYFETTLHRDYIPTELRANLIASKQKNIMYLSPAIIKDIDKLINDASGGSKPARELLAHLAETIGDHLGVKPLQEGFPEIFGIKIRSENNKART